MSAFITEKLFFKLERLSLTWIEAKRWIIIPLSVHYDLSPTGIDRIQTTRVRTKIKQQNAFQETT